MVDETRLEELRRRHRPERFPTSEELGRGLGSRSSAAFDAAVATAECAGDAGESALVDALGRVSRDRRTFLVQALRHTAAAPSVAARTNAALAALVREASGPGSLDLRVVAMGTLVARLEAQAAPLLVETLRRERQGTLKDYAIAYLAAVGDAGGVPEAVDRLRTLLRRPTRLVEGRVNVLAYLGQHPTAVDLADVTRLVRGHWQVVDPRHERPWVDRFWPHLAPGGPPPEAAEPPDGAALRRWARSSMHLRAAPMR